MSRPVRARGLKLRCWLLCWSPLTVAPCTGAWIETVHLFPDELVQLVAPCTGAWIETVGLMQKSTVGSVAPCTGAWIETPMRLQVLFLQSRPVRARGLKLRCRLRKILFSSRALYGRVD